MPLSPGSLISWCQVSRSEMRRAEAQDTMDASIGCASTVPITGEVSDAVVSPGNPPCRRRELFASPKPESPAFGRRECQ